MAKGRRRGFVSWFVEPYKQVRLGLMFLLVNFVFAALIISVFGYYVIDMYSAVATYFKLSGAESQVTMQKFGVPMAMGVGLIFLFIVTTLMVSVRYTHHIYGPLVSIHRYLDDVLGGRAPGPIQLRESDQLKDLATKLNQMAERLVKDDRAGPFVQMNRFLDDLIAGKKPTPIKLRDNDHFSELAGKLNTLAAKSHV